MRNAIVTAALLSLFVSACGAKASESDAQATKVANEVTATLKTVTSADTANAAKTRLTDLVTQLAGAMPQATGGALDKATAAAKSLASGLPAALQNLGAEVARIAQNNEALAPIKDLIAKLQGLVAGK